MVDPRLSSAPRWSVTAVLGQIDGLEFAHLSGAEAPQVESRSGLGYGVEIRVILDFGAGIRPEWRHGAARVRRCNTGDAPGCDVRVTPTADPPILRDKTWFIDRIGPGEETALRDLDTPLDPVPLAGLDEAEIGRLTVTADGLPPVETHHPIEMLARDEWRDLSEMDNILAAFVLPNRPEVARSLKEAAALLERAGQSGAMDGYQSGDPGRAWMVAGKYPSIAPAWRRAWTEVIPFFAFSAAIRKIISITNAVESLNRVLRKTLKTKGSSPPRRPQPS